MTSPNDPVPPNSPAAAVGVVLANLGTPDEPTLPAVQRYLREFLSDRRIVDLSPVIWKPILETSIMHGHAKLSTAKYASVWYPDGSPLLVHARAQAAAVAAALGAQCVAPGVREEIVTPDVSVAAGAGVAVGAGSAGDLGAAGAGGPGSRVSVTYGMRYGTPSLATALDTLRAAGAGRLLIVPLYPQFSTTTTATVIDALGAWCREAWDLPELRWVRSWATDAGYVEACARRIEACWEEWGRPDFARGDKLLLSYHGIPVTYVAAGDPYPRECEATTDLLRARLGLTAEHCLMTYQSKFGKGEWLTPATIDTVGKLGELGTGRLDVFCPGFAVDCLETLEEIGLLNRDEFLSRGGGEFRRIPCLNDSGPWTAALAAIVTSNVQGWLP